MSSKIERVSDEWIEDARKFTREVFVEYMSARRKFGPFENGHEGYAVTLEELEEVWEEIKHRTTYEHFREECIQLAAMAMAMAVELRESYE